MNERVLEEIKQCCSRLSTSVFDGRLADALGWKNYAEGYIRCAEIANILTVETAEEWRQKVQRLAKGGSA